MFKKVLKACIFPLAFSLLYLVMNGFDQLINYCNAFFVAGIVIFLFAALLWVANEGTFDIFGYSFSNLKASFSKEVEKKYESLAQYTEIKTTQRKKKEKKFTNLFISGAIFMIIGIIIRFFVK